MGSLKNGWRVKASEEYAAIKNVIIILGFFIALVAGSIIAFISYYKFYFSVLL